MKTRSAIILFALFTMTACHLDGAIFGPATDEAHFRPPDAPPTTLVGQFSVEAPFGVSGSQVSFYLADGSQAGDLSATVGEDGTFSATVPGTERFTNLLVYSNQGALALLAFFPEVASAQQVYDLPATVDLSAQAPELVPIDDVATTLTLLVEAKARFAFGGLGAVSADATQRTLTEAARQLDQEPVLTFRRMVTRLLTEAAANPDSAAPVFLAPDQALLGGSFLSTAFLQAHPIDYDDDGAQDLDTGAFEAALRAAADSLAFDVCYDPDLIKVVMQVDMRDGQLDLNCQPVETMRWITPDSGDRVFITGAVHEDQVRCLDDGDDPACATEGDVTLTNEALGNFVPNVIEMLDDGTNGDAVAGDNIFSRSFELPRGMRVGYKYNFGRGGEGWTGTEEWPGNSRLIELVDVSGDEIVVRRDVFGDESTNKDRANSLSPARGGRGSIDWDTDANGDGLLDAREVTIDLDGDCIADDFPPVGANEPLTLACE